MIVLGLVLLVVGFLLGIGILKTIGIILLIVGAVLAVVGRSHPIAGRSHFF